MQGDRPYICVYCAYVGVYVCRYKGVQCSYISIKHEFRALMEKRCAVV